MRRSRTLIAAAVLAAIVLAGCANRPLQNIEPGAEPAPDTAEGGIWLVMEKAERRLVTSGALVEDAALQAYVNELACRLSELHCDDVRVYVVRHPEFNAMMAPNGFMVIWSGLILRTENEAQLSAVIGHELAHYLHRHTLRRWNETKDTANAALALNIALAFAGLAPAGYLVNLIAVGHLAAYSRDMEREADATGFELAIKEGLEGREAAKIWNNLVAERDAADMENPDAFLASHPPSRERMETLSEMGREAPPGSLGSERFHALVEPHLPEWLEDEADLGRFERLQVILDRFKESGRIPAATWYYQGEIYRRRAGDEDLEKAVAAYREALTHPSPLPATWRSLALALWKTGDTAGAKRAFANYLEAAPQADDRQMIEYYLEKLGEDA